MEDTKTDHNERRKMQPFKAILRDQIEAYLKFPQIEAIFKARLWAELPLEQRQMVYDRLRSYFERLCAAQEPPWSVVRAFPEPVGMDEARRREIQQRGLRREDVEQGERYKE
jgi:hypothetical protein